MRQHKWLIIVVALACLLAAVAYGFVIRPLLDDRSITATVPTTIENSSLHLSFTYPSGEDAYALIEPPAVAADGELKKVYLLMNDRDYRDYQDRSDPTDAPPTVSILVFGTVEDEGEVDAGRVTKLQNWANAHSQFSSYGRISGEPEVTEVDGATALRYRADGLYQQEVYLVSYRRNTYVFTGQFATETDPIRTMFQELIRTVTLD